MCHQQSNMSESTRNFNEKDSNLAGKESYQKDPSLNKGGCGCGCGVKAKPMDEEIIDVEEDFEY